MYAIAFDLVVADTNKHHPRGVSQAYADIANTLINYGFTWVQGSLYVNSNEDMANLFEAINALKSLSWFPASVRDIRAFRIEQWSNFTGVVKRAVAKEKIHSFPVEEIID
jgi:virulence-associated protein VapD